MGELQAFWSYVHQDDDAESGRIVGLAHLLEKRLQLLTGSEATIFVDRDGLKWGDDWANKIDEVLLSTTFFIPIITPSYFSSDSCRSELLRFSSTAEHLGLDELILPIYYVDVSELNEPGPSGDDLIDLVGRYQWQDWREVALDDANYSGHRKAVHRLALEFLRRAEVADAKPTAPTRRPPRLRVDIAETMGTPESEDVADEDIDGAPDRLGDLAEFEAAMPRIGERLREMTPLVGELGQYAAEAGTELHKSDAAGRGFAGRLAVNRRYAVKLDGVADRLEPLVVGYLEELRRADPGVTTLLEILREEPSQIAALSGLLDSLLGLTVNAEESTGSTETLIHTMQDNAKWSKDLRRPTSRITKALRQTVDARTIFTRWRLGIDAVRLLEKNNPSG